MPSSNQRTNLTFSLSPVVSVFVSERRSQGSAHGSSRPPRRDSPKWSETRWGRKFVQSATLVLALLCSTAVVMADVKISTKSAAGGQSFTSTTYIKGARQRTEGMGYTTIYQCDLKRMIQINDKTRSYLITPVAGADKSTAASPQRPGAAARRGGVVTYKTINTDTGERKQMLGLTARHIKSKILITSSEGACNAMNMEMETDGWYVDLPAGLGCPTDGSSAYSFPMNQSECVDEVRYQTEGPANRGYPVLTTTTIKFNTGESEVAAHIPTSSSTQEVVDISTATIDQALFEIPAGYREVKSAQELGSPY